MKKFGIAALGLTLVLMIPFLFVLSRNAIGANQYFVIVASVLLLVLWTIPYATLIDPWLRRSAGALFNVKLEWRGTSKSMSWTPDEETGMPNRTLHRSARICFHHSLVGAVCRSNRSGTLASPLRCSQGGSHVYCIVTKNGQSKKTTCFHSALDMHRLELCEKRIRPGTCL